MFSPRPELSARAEASTSPEQSKENKFPVRSRAQGDCPLPPMPPLVLTLTRKAQQLTQWGASWWHWGDHQSACEPKRVATLPSAFLAEYHKLKGQRREPSNHGVLVRVQGTGSQPSSISWGEGIQRYKRHVLCTSRSLLQGIKTLLYHCCRCFKTTQHLPRASCHHSWLSSELPEGMTLGDKALHQESFLTALKQ